MACNSIEAQGTAFKVDISSTLTDVGSVISFSGPGGSASVIDTTCLSGTAKTKRMGLMDEGQLTLELNLDGADAAQTQLRTLRSTRAQGTFQLVLNDTGNTTMDFDGYVLSFTISGSVDDVVKASVTIEIDGAVTWS